MSFTDPLFYACLAVAVMAYHLLPVRWRPSFLLLLSYSFYALAAPAWLFLLPLATLAAYVAGLKLADAASERARRLFLFAGVAIQLSIILWFKTALAFTSLLIPLGLSYYAFKLISYLADVYWDASLVQRDGVRFFLYPAFFAQLPSGPIQRADDFGAQFAADGSTKADYVRFVAGVKLILGGLILKLLIADRIGAAIAEVDKSMADFRWSFLLLIAFCAPLQLFADFAGYTNMAIGIARLFGIESPQNFNAPFSALNMLDYWRRWHMTLTSWMTDYVFIPLNMTLRRLGTAAMVISITTTMTLIGLWHGFTVNFLIFGLLHSAILMATRLTAGLRDRMFGGATRTRSVLGLGLTWILIALPMVFWHNPQLAGALTELKLLFGLAPTGRMGVTDLASTIGDPLPLCALLALYIGAGAPGWHAVAKRFSWAAIPDWAVCGLALLLICVLAPQTGGHFIYGQF
jgi:D-alanyl-lipoteichoic acid acyltransferase DltB (MBOAT superfamily)